MIYLVNMSKGDKIHIDESDLEKIRQNIGEPLIQVKQGIINPSFMISIVPTDQEEFVTKRKTEIRDGKAYVTESENIPALGDLMGRKQLKA